MSIAHQLSNVMLRVKYINININDKIIKYKYEIKYHYTVQKQHASSTRVLAPITWAADRLNLRKSPLKSINTSPTCSGPGDLTPEDGLCFLSPLLRARLAFGFALSSRELDSVRSRGFIAIYSILYEASGCMSALF